MPLPPVLQTVESSSVPPPLALTARDEAGAAPAALLLPADDAADAVALGRDSTEAHVTRVMEMGIREYRDHISRLEVALLALGIAEYVIAEITQPTQPASETGTVCVFSRRWDLGGTKGGTVVECGGVYCF